MVLIHPLFPYQLLRVEIQRFQLYFLNKKNDLGETLRLNRELLVVLLQSPAFNRLEIRMIEYLHLIHYFFIEIGQGTRRTAKVNQRTGIYNLLHILKEKFKGINWKKVMRVDFPFSLGMERRIARRYNGREVRSFLLNKLNGGNHKIHIILCLLMQLIYPSWEFDIDQHFVDALLFGELHNKTHLSEQLIHP